MAAQTERNKVIVLRKTKLSESDLIITMLTEDGSQLRVVARGARKPTSSFATRLELFCFSELFYVKGRNLDIAKEVKLVKSFSGIRGDYEKTSAVLPGLELLEKATYQSLSNNTLFPLTLKFLETVEASEGVAAYKALCAAYLIKVCSVLGYQPGLMSCVRCGQDMRKMVQNINLPLNFSFVEGGLLCGRCLHQGSNVKINDNVLYTINRLLHMTFDQINNSEKTDESFDTKLLDKALDFCRKWIICYVANKIKSLDFYIKNF